MTEVSTGFYTALGVGTFASTSDPNYWYFNANAGDHVTIRVERRDPAIPFIPSCTLRTYQARRSPAWAGGAGGVAELDNITIPTSGTYFVNVYSNNNPASYQLRVDQSLANVGPQLDATPGGSQSSSTVLNVTSPAQGNFGGTVAGALPVGDNGDYYALGTFVTGNEISLTTGAALDQLALHRRWLAGRRQPECRAGREQHARVNHDERDFELHDPQWRRRQLLRDRANRLRQPGHPRPVPAQCRRDRRASPDGYTSTSLPAPGERPLPLSTSLR